MANDLVLLLQRRFNLTEAEASVTLAIGEGRRLADIANGRGVSVHTVRNQLKSAFVKTHCRRQSEIVLLVQSLRQNP